MRTADPTVVNAAPASSAPRYVTLALTTLLHAFTHAYGTILVPLYLLMRDDLHRSGVKSIALIVALYGIVYSLLSYPAGILADRFDRKNLLGVGLVGNAAVVLAMGLTRRYELLVLLGVVGGAFGSLFHPAANALIPAHFPRHLGLAIGMLGIGSGLGFFAGPQYAGWRADVVGPAGKWGLSAWQVPCVEMGAFGILIGLIYLAFAREAPVSASEKGRARGRPLEKGMRRKIFALAGVLGCRDFAGIATMSLVSIYLQKAHGYDTKQTGWIVGAMMLISMVANPIAVWVSNGTRRLPTLMSILVAGGLMLIAAPYVPVAWLLPFLAVFQVFHLGSYAVSEASLLERVDPAVRGRIIGLFITFAGTFASSSPWVMGFWTDALGQRAYHAEGYRVPFAVLGGMMLWASLSVKIIAGLCAGGRAVTPTPRGVEQAIDPMVEPVG